MGVGGVGGRAAGGGPEGRLKSILNGHNSRP